MDDLLLLINSVFHYLVEVFNLCMAFIPLAMGFILWLLRKAVKLFQNI